MDIPAVRVDALCHAYPDGSTSLHGVSFALAAGERLAVIGPNGAGKSSLLLHLNGILRAQRGSVAIFGTAVADAALRDIRRRVGMVFQHPDDQLFCPSVFEDIAFGPRNLGLDEAEVARRVAEAVRTTGLDGLEQRAPYHLSIGQKRRAALATVLSMRPDLLVLDEPTANLDPRGRRELLALLEAMPYTMIVATHNLEFARALCPQCLLLDKGAIAASGPTGAILDDVELLLEHGL